MKNKHLISSPELLHAFKSSTLSNPGKRYHLHLLFQVIRYDNNMRENMVYHTHKTILFVVFWLYISTELGESINYSLASSKLSENTPTTSTENQYRDWKIISFSFLICFGLLKCFGLFCLLLK